MGLCAFESYFFLVGNYLDEEDFSEGFCLCFLFYYFFVFEFLTVFLFLFEFYMLDNELLEIRVLYKLNVYHSTENNRSQD